jgi:hypothetical protein
MILLDMHVNDIGQYFETLPAVPFLNTGVMIAFFQSVGRNDQMIQILHK